MNLPPQLINSPSGLPIYYRGAPLESGKLPAFFYFSLSGEDSLHLDPFNQPVIFLENYPIRVYSCTIPGHGPGLKNTEAMKWWADKIHAGQNPLNDFFEQCITNLSYLIHNGLIDEHAVAVGGLSRGSFVATHLAARDQRIKNVVGFAPLTTTRTIQEFADLENNPIVKSLNLELYTNPLIKKKIRYYIGNRDTRVGTDACFQFIQKITNHAFEQKIRSPNTELIIGSSIGHKGHGTAPHVFKDGAQWILSALNINSTLQS